MSDVAAISWVWKKRGKEVLKSYTPVRRRTGKKNENKIEPAWADQVECF